MISAESEARMVLMTIFVLSGLVGVGLIAWWFSPYGSNYSESTASVTPSSSIFSDDCSVFDNYANSLRDTTSLTDIDFGVAALEEDVGVCNRILQERLSGRTIVVDVPYAHSEA
ncbi:hypothetical protein M8J75_011336 [Diaphorina citri]|nr:hypothetical protein M8J75_011336 [Diaphorina citri]